MRGCMVDSLGAVNLGQSMEAKEIRKFVGMERGMRPLPPHNPPPFPPAVPLTDGSKGGWVDGLKGLKLCSPIL